MSNLITRKHVDRRMFLRGLGAAIALPMLDAMTPAFAATVGMKAKAPVRMSFTYVPNGVNMAHWKPGETGSQFSLPSILEPLEPFRRQLTVFSGLTDNGGRGLGDGPGDHARAASSFLTGVHPKKTAGADIAVGVSVDQVAAQKIGGVTKFPSLEFGVEDGRLVGSCDSGYSCAYSNSISWRTPSTPNPPEVNPRVMFERLFGNAAGDSPAMRAKHDRYNKSILDFVLDDTKSLTSQLGATDRRKIDEYLSGVRELERRIQMAEKDPQNVRPSMEKPAGVPIDYGEHVRLLFDLQAVAFQTDMTRVTTFMMGREGSNRGYREIGVADGHHSISHHKNDPELLAKVAKINRYHMEHFAYFLNKLKTIQEADGSTLLDNVMIVYGSGISDGNKHNHNDLPVLLAGGAFTGGRHIRVKEETPVTNLFLSMLDRVGVQPESIGDSSGKLEHLTDL